MSARLLTLLAAVFVYCTVTGTGHVEKPPLTCTDNGKQYPLYAKWPSTTPGECAEFTCQGNDTIAGVACPTVEVEENPGRICYDISVHDAPYPYCCTAYHCVDRTGRPA